MRNNVVPLWRPTVPSDAKHNDRSRMQQRIGESDQGSYAYTMPPLPFDEGLTEVLAAWRQHALAAGQSERTITSRAYTIRRLAAWCDPLAADRDELTTWLATLVDSRTGRAVTRSTKATYRAQLTAFYAYLLDTGRREDDPALKVPKPRIHQGPPRPVTPAQVDAILAACQDTRARQTAAYVLLAAFAGMRVSEIAQVRGEDFDSDYVYLRGKGDKPAALPLSSRLSELVEVMPKRGWWFPTDSESGHVHRCSVSSAIKRAMIRAGVPGTPHALRHHFGTQILRASGGDLRVTQELMRHSSPQTTARYTQIDDDRKRAVVGMIA